MNSSFSKGHPLRLLKKERENTRCELVGDILSQDGLTRIVTYKTGIGRGEARFTTDVAGNERYHKFLKLLERGKNNGKSKTGH